ncbi:MAG: NAD(P)-dependent oxidoreductase, partial [bacterium]
MKHDIRKVLIAGGTGFLGYHAACLFAARGVAVDVIALPHEIDLSGWFPQKFGITTGDLFTMTAAEIVALMASGGYDAFIYALGPDDRTVPAPPAVAFFHEKLVVQSAKICAAAKQAGIGRCVVLGSYYAHFDRVMGGRLSHHHPYIRARVDQEQALHALGEPGKFDVMILELPFIFGTMPARQPLWKEFFLDY